MIRKPRKLKPYTDAWERLANALARAYAPDIYDCVECGGPVCRGYVCQRCGCNNPSERPKG